jgi:hypothetical protein
MPGLLSLQEIVFLGENQALLGQDEEVSEDIYGDAKRDFWTLSKTVQIAMTNFRESQLLHTQTDCCMTKLLTANIHTTI